MFQKIFFWEIQTALIAQHFLKLLQYEISKIYITPISNYESKFQILSSYRKTCMVKRIFQFCECRKFAIY